MQVCTSAHALAQFLAECVGTARPDQLLEKQVSDLKDRLRVCKILEGLGLTTGDVPEADTKRCDLRASDGEGEHYLIEVKGFHDNADGRQGSLAGRIDESDHIRVRRNVAANPRDLVRHSADHLRRQLKAEYVSSLPVFLP